MGENKKLNIKLAFQGKGATIAMYIYDKGGTWLGTINTTRIPNAEQTKDFVIVFNLPEKKMKNKAPFSFRIVLEAPKACKVSKFSMTLDK
jgi:glucan biosynthesis protein